MSEGFVDCWRDGRLSFLHVPCLCGARAQESDAILLATRDRYGFPVHTWLSRRSGLLWTSPRLTEKGLEEFYSGHFQSIYRGAGELIALRYARQILRSEPILEFIARATGFRRFDGKVVFDIGCSAGGMLEGFRELGARVAGSDLGGKDYLKFGADRGLDLEEGTEEVLAAKGPADLILLVQMIEHLGDPIGFLRQIKGLLAPGGLVYVEVPGVMNLAPYRHDFLRYLQNSHPFHFS